MLFYFTILSIEWLFSFFADQLREDRRFCMTKLATCKLYVMFFFTYWFDCRFRFTLAYNRNEDMMNCCAAIHTVNISNKTSEMIAFRFNEYVFCLPLFLCLYWSFSNIFYLFVFHLVLASTHSGVLIHFLEILPLKIPNSHGQRFDRESTKRRSTT